MRWEKENRIRSLEKYSTIHANSIRHSRTLMEYWFLLYHDTSIWKGLAGNQVKRKQFFERMWQGIVNGVSNCDNQQEKPAMTNTCPRFLQFGERLKKLKSGYYPQFSEWGKPEGPQSSTLMILCVLRMPCAPFNFPPTLPSAPSQAEIPTLNRGFSSCTRPHAYSRGQQNLQSPRITRNSPFYPF